MYTRNNPRPRSLAGLCSSVAAQGLASSAAAGFLAARRRRVDLHARKVSVLRLFPEKMACRLASVRSTGARASTSGVTAAINACSALPACQTRCVGCLGRDTPHCCHRNTRDADQIDQSELSVCGCFEGNRRHACVREGGAGLYIPPAPWPTPPFENGEPGVGITGRSDAIC